jgi:hypothetical protein
MLKPALSAMELVLQWIRTPPETAVALVAVSSSSDCGAAVGAGAVFEPTYDGAGELDFAGDAKMRMGADVTSARETTKASRL